MKLVGLFKNPHYAKNETKTKEEEVIMMI